MKLSKTEQQVAERLLAEYKVKLEQQAALWFESGRDLLKEDLWLYGSVAGAVRFNASSAKLDPEFAELDSPLGRRALTTFVRAYVKENGGP